MLTVDFSEVRGYDNFLLFMDAHALTGQISDEALCWIIDWCFILVFWDMKVISTRSDEIILLISVISL